MYCVALLNPGHLFDLNGLSQEGGYILYDNLDNLHLKKMFRLNVCGEVTNAGCGPDTGTTMLYLTGSGLAGKSLPLTGKSLIPTAII